VKYSTLRIWPVFSYGASTGFAPIHVSIRKIPASSQKRGFFWGLYFLDSEGYLDAMGPIRYSRDANMARTPPSFDGIDRKIAYANRKYHSG